MNDRICPYCNKSFSMFGIDYYEKHVARCRKKLTRYTYSDRKPGRPPGKDKRV